MEEVAVWLFPMISSLIQIAATPFLLLYLIGWQALVAVMFLCFLVPFYAEMSSASATLRLRIAAESDKRISLMAQVVSGIRAIKTHAWEDEYREMIKNRRR